MKTKHIVFLFLMTTSVSSLFSQADMNADEKYNHYRTQLKQRFMYYTQDATVRGSHLPVELIQVDAKGETTAYWADATWWQGHYIAMLALEYLKAHTHLLDISEDIFENWNIHVHVPEGAIPKDGPSAGITMVTSLASALTQRKVKPNLAMTGEITLRGKVLPVGGIKEKILAAKRAGIKEIILCEENRKNIDEIQPEYLKGLTFHYVTDITEVLDLALTDEKVNDAIDFCVEKNKNEENK